GEEEKNIMSPFLLFSFSPPLFLSLWLIMQNAYDSGTRLAVIRRCDDGRNDQFGCGGRDAGDFSGADLVGASRNNRERHERHCACARRVVERLRLSRRDTQSAAQIPLSADSQRRGRRYRRGITQTNSAHHIRLAGPFSDPLRDDPVYDAGACSTLVAVGG